MLRRFLAKFPSMHDTVANTLQTYHVMGFVGTQKLELRGLGNSNAHKLPARGPIGLLLQSLSLFHHILTPTFEAQHAFSLPFNMFSIPWQVLRTRLQSNC